MKIRIVMWMILALFPLAGAIAQKPGTRLDVYYFHSTRRCATCKAIEENTRKTLNTWFPEQMKNGTIKMTMINVDEEKNQAMAEKYEAAGSALFLTKTVNGKETRKDMSDFAFSWARTNPEKYMSGLKETITKFLQ